MTTHPRSTRSTPPAPGSSPPPGDVDAATAWAREHRVGPDDDLTYLREYEHLTLARVLLAQHRADPSTRTLPAAVGLLDRLLAAAEAGSRAGTVLEVEVLRTLALRAAGEPELAQAALEHALDLAEPDGWVRFFVDAGPAMAEALAELGTPPPPLALPRAAVRRHAGRGPRAPRGRRPSSSSTR